MNVQKIYSDAVGRVPRQLGELTPDGASPTEEQMSKQHLVDWKSDSITVQMFKEMNAEMKSLIEQAVSLSLTYHQHKDHYQIIGLLIRANTIKKQIDTYANSH